MAFISVREMVGKPSVGFSKSKAGHAFGSFSVGFPLRGERVDFQIDEDSCQVRVRADSDGAIVNKSSGQFSVPKRVQEVLGNQRIILVDNEDGWWYGSYYREGATK